MNRFDRDDGGHDVLGQALGSATDEFKSALEREVQEVIEAARKRAVRIEWEAARRAEEIEREAERSATRGIHRDSERISSLRENIERLDRTLREALAPLRAEVESLAAESLTDPSPPPDAEQPQVEQSRAPSVQEVLAQTPPAPKPHTEEPRAREFRAEEPRATPPPANVSQTGPINVAPEEPMTSPQIDAERLQMIHSRLLAMRSDGASRAEAEGFLSRVGGEELRGLLGQIYPEDDWARPASGRKGLLRRRRR